MHPACPEASRTPRCPENKPRPPEACWGSGTHTIAPHLGASTCSLGAAPASGLHSGAILWTLALTATLRFASRLSLKIPGPAQSRGNMLDPFLSSTFLKYGETPFQVGLFPRRGFQIPKGNLSHAVLFKPLAHRPSRRYTLSFCRESQRPRKQARTSGVALWPRQNPPSPPPRSLQLQRGGGAGGAGAAPASGVHSGAVLWTLPLTAPLTLSSWLWLPHRPWA